MLSRHCGGAKEIGFKVQGSRFKVSIPIPLSVELSIYGYFKIDSANLLPGNQELLHLSSVKFCKRRNSSRVSTSLAATLSRPFVLTSSRRVGCCASLPCSSCPSRLSS